jgi:hypothetical protein
MRNFLEKAGAALALGALVSGGLSPDAASANPIFRGQNFAPGIRNIIELPVCGFDCPTGYGPGAAIPHTSEFTVWHHNYGAVRSSYRWH